jgi:putative nucleotidyltransferase with HDIG domain
MTTAATKRKRRSAPRRSDKAPVKDRGPRANRADPKRRAAQSPEGSRSSRGRGHGGRRLSDAFETVSHLPALSESRRRVVQACQQSASPGEVAEAVESDPGLTIAVMRAAANEGSPSRSGGVSQAVDVLSAAGVRAIAASVDVYDPFESPSAWSERHERFRRHAVATRHAAERIAELARLGERDELAVAALLHDVGRLVLAELYSEFERLGDGAATPDERIRRERRELGIDHALVGAVLVRRWSFPPGFSAWIERHHAPDAEAMSRRFASPT